MITEQVMEKARVVNVLMPAQLTVGDLDFIKMLCLPYKIIGQSTGLDNPAIRMRVSRLAVKLGVETRTAIVVKAIKLGIVQIDEMAFREFDGQKNPLHKES